MCTTRHSDWNAASAGVGCGFLIKRETGITAQRYIQNKVVDLSKQYVLDTSLSVNQVACRLGFQYPQHFTRMFKKMVGVTPSEYRQ